MAVLHQSEKNLLDDGLVILRMRVRVEAEAYSQILDRLQVDPMVSVGDLLWRYPFLVCADRSEPRACPSLRP